MIYLRTVAPASAPVDIEEIRAQVWAQGFQDDDGVLEGFVNTATAYFDGRDGILGRCLMTQTWEARYPKWCEVICLPFPDIQSVTLTYLDSKSNSQTVNSSHYEFLEITSKAQVFFKPSFGFPVLSTNTVAPIKFELVAGFGTASDVPAPIKTAIMMLAAHYYDHRSAVVTDANPIAVPMGIEMLTNAYRRTMV